MFIAEGIPKENGVSVSQGDVVDVIVADVHGSGGSCEGATGMVVPAAAAAAAAAAEVAEKKKKGTHAMLA